MGSNEFDARLLQAPLLLCCLGGSGREGRWCET